VSGSGDGTGPLSLARLRSALDTTWLLALFGVAYLVSQATILFILGPVRADLAELQLLGWSSEAYLATFHRWEMSGAMSAYRAHFVLDDVHWVWYAGLFTVLLCRLFERHRLPHRFDWLLVLPLASGLLDWYENHLQHVFLDSPDYAAIVDPLPLLSTLASWGKWTLAACYVLLGVALLVRRPSRREERRPV
jgi:hypothetical protein